MLTMIGVEKKGIKTKEVKILEVGNYIMLCLFR